MKLKDLSQEEIDAMSYDDIAYLILEEADKKMKITDLFKKVCKFLNLDDNIYESKIADFFELLSTDKKFILLDNGFWDLREKHTQKIKLNGTEEVIEVSDDIEDIDLEEIETEEDEEEDIFYEGDETDDESENDLKDLVVMDEEEEANS